MKKKLSVIALFLFFTLASPAQSNMSVSTFRPLERDLTAITNGTMEIDQNGETAALIKVVTTQTDLWFDGGMMGIIKSVQKTGEVWVYVCRGSRKITIKHSRGTLRDYEFPCAIEAGRTYELVLNNGELEKDNAGNILDANISPKSAVLIISDGEANEIISLDDYQGHYHKSYPYGDYIYRVEHRDYFPETGTFSIRSGEKTSLNVSLQSAIATLVINCPTNECDIFVNGVKKATKSYYSGEVREGEYVIRISKLFYRSYYDTLFISRQERRTVSAPALVYLYGSLMVDYRPVGAEIYLDGIKRGLCPEIIKDIPPGEHEVMISKVGYQTKTVKVKVTEDKRSKISGTLNVVSTTEKSKYQGQNQSEVNWTELSETLGNTF